MRKKKLKLSKFLKKNNAYKKFINNFDKRYFKKESIYLNFVGIFVSFDWMNTPEGDEYWDILHRKWMDKDRLKVYDMDWLLEKGKKK